MAKSQGDASCPGWHWGHGHTFPAHTFLRQLPMAHLYELPLSRSWWPGSTCVSNHSAELQEKFLLLSLQPVPQPRTDMLCFCPPALFSPAAKTWWRQGGRMEGTCLTPCPEHSLTSGFSHFLCHLTSTSPALQSRRGLTGAAPTKPYQEQEPEAHCP